MANPYDRLLTDLLNVLDAVDQACAHWQAVEAEMAEAAASESVAKLPQANLPGASPATPPAPELNPLQRAAKTAIAALESLFGLPQAVPESSAPPIASEADAIAPPGADSSDNPAPSELAEIIASGREGAELIQRSLLDALRQQNITPIPALGQPFDSKTMFAIDRQPDPSLPENTILEELVRGYRQKDKILREAQVIVSSKT